MNNPRKPLLIPLLWLSPLVFLPSLIAQPLNQPLVSDLPVLGKPCALAANHATLISPASWISGSLFPRQLTPTEARQRLAQVATAWFNQWGNANVVLQGNSTTKPWLSLELSLLLPLYQTHQQLFLIQPGVQHHQKQTTYSWGFGSRHWPADKSYWWGNHLFYDYCPQGSHHRLGFAGECQTERYRFTVNGYLPLSQWRQDNQQSWERRAARGFDLRLQRQLWQQPCLYLNTLFEHYWGQSLVSLDNAKPSLRPTALTLAIDYIPVPLVTASYGCQWASGGKLSHQYRIQLTYRLGVPLAQQIDPGLAAVVYTPAANRLAVIQRRSRMVLEQRARLVNTPDGPSKPVEDTIQLTIPASAQGDPGASLALNIALNSSCSATEWNYFGEGSFIRADSGYSVKADEGKLALQLPQQPGQYRLRLRAQKINGQDSDSNEMIVEVNNLSTRMGRTSTPPMAVDDQAQSESGHPTDREEAAPSPPAGQTESVSSEQESKQDKFNALVEAGTSSSSEMASQIFDQEKENGPSLSSGYQIEREEDDLNLHTSSPESFSHENNNPREVTTTASSEIIREIQPIVSNDGRELKHIRDFKTVGDFRKLIFQKTMNGPKYISDDKAREIVEGFIENQPFESISDIKSQKTITPNYADALMKNNPDVDFNPINK
ncbi:MAG: inverse autotransporter beta domain-containing protein [Candidatus Symbiodolus clandestinus]